MRRHARFVALRRGFSATLHNFRFARCRIRLRASRLIVRIRNFFSDFVFLRLSAAGSSLVGVLSETLYGGWDPVWANVVLGLISAVVDNIPVMFAVLSMAPDMSEGNWLLITLTAGVGGSLLLRRSSK